MPRSHPSRLARLVLVTILSPVGALTAQRGPPTTAERTDFAATSRYTDVMGFIAELQRLSPNLHVETMATTVEGRPIPLLVLGDPVPASPEALRDDDRLRVYFQANIHAGEVEGKEAAQMLARDVLLGETRDYLDRLVILIAPIFNADGNEQISTENRRDQHGPAQGVGVRYNGQRLDLNRDGLKLETPEVRGLIQNVLRRWDPAFFLDSHTHNGSYHQEPVTWTWGLNPNGDRPIFEYMAEVLLPDITNRMQREYGTLTVPHGDFADVRDPTRGWVPLGPQPRYLSNYVGLRNRLSVLNEQYPYADFRTRVYGAYSLFLALLDHLHDHATDVQTLVREADRRAARRGAEQDAFIVEFGREPIAARVTIRGWEMEIVRDQETGRPRVHVTDEERVWEDVPYLARYTAERSVAFPRAYLITVRDDEIVNTLLTHGIVVERLTAPISLTVEAFSVTGVTPSSRLNQGHFTSSVEGEYLTLERTFPTGTYVVRTTQPLSAVAAALLEPESDDGLVFWNFFDRYLAAQWGNQPQTYPVFRLLQSARLPTEGLNNRPAGR